MPTLLPDIEIGEFSTLVPEVNTGTVFAVPPLVVVTLLCAAAPAASAMIENASPANFLMVRNPFLCRVS